MLRQAAKIGVLAVCICVSAFGEDYKFYYKFVHDQTINDAMTQDSTFWYSDKTFKRVIENDHKLYPHGFNIAGRLDKTGSAVNEQPWKVTSGVEDVLDVITIKRFVYVPSKVKLRARKSTIPERGNIPKLWIEGEYPDGSVTGQVFTFRGVVFSIRGMQREEGFWHGEEYVNQEAIVPVGYKRASTCVDCHEDVTKDSFEIDPKRDWYGTIGIGSEIGGPIGFHPFDWRESYHKTTKSGRGLRLGYSNMRVNADVAHLFDYTEIKDLLDETIDYSTSATTDTDN
jgi:hypothetical protein